ncbi:MAG TPA: aromatic ring-hydroxylating dioxygenase subunit alpha [Tepidisphaeraceae bacterium]|jgi:Rieske 2Fe-2S family protein
MNRREPLTRLEEGLPAGWYYDPAHYQRELEVFWSARWVAAAREEEVPAAGDWRLVRLGTQSIILLRDSGGRIRAFHNICRHRGSVLCTQEQGCFERDRIVCPYHSWVYDLCGDLVATPNRMETPDFQPEDFPLFEVAVDTWGGFIFINLSGATATPLRQALGDLEDRFERYGFADLRIGKRIVADVRANWKLLVENFSECFHCPPVHPELCRVVTAYRDAGAWGLRGGPETKPEYKPGAVTLTLDGSARLPPFRGLNDEERRTVYIAEMLPPNLFLNVHPDYVNAHVMFPTGPQSVRIVYDWLFESQQLPLAEADLAHYVALWDVTNRQDARNCEWQQEGMHSREFTHGVYVPQEFDSHRFAQWVRAALGEAQRE